MRGNHSQANQSTNQLTRELVLEAYWSYIRAEKVTADLSRNQSHKMDDFECKEKCTPVTFDFHYHKPLFQLFNVFAGIYLQTVFKTFRLNYSAIQFDSLPCK